MDGSDESTKPSYFAPCSPNAHKHPNNISAHTFCNINNLNFHKKNPERNLNIKKKCLISASYFKKGNHVSSWTYVQVHTEAFMQTFPVKIMIEQKQTENVKSLKYLGSMLTNDGNVLVKLNP